jgi:DNA-binding LytR/AlgR family response regulator
MIPLNENLILKCVAVDDEPFALKLIEDDISKIGFLKLLKTFSSPTEALSFLRKEQVDLIFLDVQMPVLRGTDFIRQLENRPMVIFTTAYEQYAVEGFELEVIDYLVKPILFDRFVKAVNKAREQFQLRTSSSEKTDPGFFFVHSEYKEIKIFLDSIQYIEGLKDYVKIYLQNQQRPILTRLNLKAIEAKLPHEKFCRVHNSFIVPFSKITSIQKSQIFLGSQSIPIGEKFSDEFRKRFKGGS